MVQVVLFEHPFKTERSITERPAGVIRSYLPPTSLDFFVVRNDQRAALDDLAEDGDTIILRAIPAGYAEPKSLEDRVAMGNDAPAKVVGGAFLVGLGLTLLAFPPLALVGLAFAVGGAALATIGTAIGLDSLYAKDKLGKVINGKGQTRPDIRGARNQANPNGKLPLILGKHKLFPYYACTPYTSFETPTGGDAKNNAGQDMYLNILFALGYAPLKISNVKIGEITISTPERSTDGALDVTDCPYAGITGYFTNGSIPAAFPYVIKEEQVNITLEGTEYGTSVGAATPPTAFSALSIVVAATARTVTAPVGTNLDTDYAFKPGQMVKFSGFTNAGNNGYFIIVNVRQVSGTGTNRQLVLASESTSLVNETKTGVNYFVTPINMVTTPKDTTEITVHLTFPQGFAGYDSSGAVNGAPLVVKAYYRLKGTLAWSEFPYFVGSSWTLSGFKAKSTIRLASTQTGLTAGEYEVRLAREIGATDNKDGVNYYDTTVWSTLQCKTGTSVCTDPTNVSFLYLKLKATSALSGNLDQISLTAEATYTEAVTGANWTEDAAYRYSPAAALLWILTGPANPRPLSGADRATFIDYTRIEAWRDYCAATVSGAQFHTCNAVVTESFSMQQLISLIATTGRGFFYMNDGKYSVGWDAATTTVVQCLTPRNSWDFQWTKRFDEIPNLLKISFINAADDWTADEAQVFLDGGSVASTPKEAISSWGITASGEIYREGRYSLKNRILRPESYTVMMDAEQLACTLGDRIEVAHDALLVGGSWGRIKTVTLDGSSQPVSITVDEPCNMITATVYAVRIRNQAGAVYSLVDTVVGENYTLTFDSPLTAGSIGVGDLFQFGVQNLESLAAIVVGIEMQEDLSARLSLVPYDANVFDEDSIAPPTFVSKISKKPEFSPALVGIEVDRASQVAVSGAQRALVGGRYWGRYLDTATIPAPASPAVGDLYTKFSLTPGDANRGVFRWDGTDWVRTEERQYIMRAVADIGSILAYIDTPGVPLYGTAADYSDDATAQEDLNAYKTTVEVIVPTNAPKYLGSYAGASFPAGTHVGDWVVCSADGSGRTKGLVYESDGATTWTATTAPDKLGRAMDGLLALSATETTGPAVTFVQSMIAMNATILALQARVLYIQNMLYGGERFDDEGAVIDEAKDGFSLPASGAFQFEGPDLSITKDRIRLYKGAGVQRRALEVSDEALTWLDTPSGGSEQLRGRLGRLGVGPAIIMDGEYNVNIEANVSDSIAIPSSVGNGYAVYLELQNGDLYMFFTNYYLSWRKWNGLTWDSPVVINNVEAAFWIHAIQTQDGNIRVVFDSGTSGLIYECIYSGGTWSARSLVSDALGGANPKYEQLLNGQLRVSYTTYASGPTNGYLVEKIWNGSAWGVEVSCGFKGSYQSYIQMKSGQLRMTYVTYSTGLLYETVWNGSTWDAPVLINNYKCVMPKYAQMLNGDLILYYYVDSSKYTVKRILNGSTWGDEIVISNVTSETLLNTIQLSNGSMRYLYRLISDTSLVERTALLYSRLGAGIIKSWRGTDANGLLVEYVQYSNGRMEVNGDGGDWVFQNAVAVSKTITFPAPFLTGSIPQVFPATGSSVPGQQWVDGTYIENPTASGFNWVVRLQAVANGTVVGSSYHAIGRWK